MRSWAIILGILCGLVLGLGTPNLAGCGSPRPVAPALPPAPGAPADDAPADQREAYWRRQVAESKAQLAAAQEEARAAEDKTWRVWTRWVGLAGIVLAVAAGGALSLLVTPRLGLPVAAIIAACALSVVAYGATIRWLPLTLGASAALAGGLWLLYHLRHIAVADRASLALDAVEREGTEAVRAAKAALGAAVDRAALRPRFNRLRGKVAA
jgi:hypothetical protein